MNPCSLSRPMDAGKATTPLDLGLREDDPSSYGEYVAASSQPTNSHKLSSELAHSPPSPFALEGHYLGQNRLTGN